MSRQHFALLLSLFCTPISFANDQSGDGYKRFAVSSSVMDLVSQLLGSYSSIYGFAGEYRFSPHWGASAFVLSSQTRFSNDSYLDQSIIGFRGNYYFSPESERGIYTSLWGYQLNVEDRYLDCKESITKTTLGWTTGYRWVFSGRLFFNLGIGLGVPTDKYWLCSYGSNGAVGMVDMNIGYSF